MLKDCLAVLEIGTSKISLIIGEKSVNGTFAFRAKETEDYYAYFDGEFSDVKSLEDKIKTLYQRVIDNSELSAITKIFVGVSGEFSKTISKNYKITFNKLKTVGINELKTLYELGFDSTDCEYSLMHRSAVYYVVDNVKTHKPIGKKCLSLGARLSYSLVSNNYKEVVSGILSRLGVKTIHFISEDFARSQYLFPESQLDECKIIVDVGGVSTSLCIACGEGLLYSSAFPLGGGLITAYLSDKFLCDYDVAEVLKRKLNLGLRDNYTATYIVDDRIVGDYEFSRDRANEVAKDVLDSIAEKTDKALSACTLNVPSDVETYFTGGGVCMVRGAVEYLASRLGVLPKTVAPNLPHYNKPIYSDKLSLLYVAHKYCNNKIFFT